MAPCIGLFAGSGRPRVPQGGLPGDVWGEGGARSEAGRAAHGVDGDADVGTVVSLCSKV